MIKTVSLIMIVCLMLALVGCGEQLPNPEAAVADFFVSLQDMDGALAQSLMENSLAKELVGDLLEQAEEEPEQTDDETDDETLTAKEAYLLFVEAYLKQIKVEMNADKTEIDNRAKTAHVIVSMSIVDIQACQDKASGQLQDWVDMVMASGRKPEESEKHLALLEYLKAAVEDAETPRLQGDQIIFLTYDANAQAWDIDNGDDIVNQFKF